MGGDLVCGVSHAERGALGSLHTTQQTAASFNATYPPEGPVCGVHPHQNLASPVKKQKALELRPSGQQQPFQEAPQEAGSR